MKQNRFKQRLAMLMMAGMAASQISVPTFAVEASGEEANGIIYGYYGQQLFDGDNKATTSALLYADMYNFWVKDGQQIRKFEIKTTEDVSTNEKLNEFLDKYNMAFAQARQALSYDYPDTYWMVGTKHYTTVSALRGELKDGKTPVTIEMKIATLSELEGDQKIRESIVKCIQDAKEKIEAGISTSASDYQKVIAINKYLVENFKYNEDAVKVLPTEASDDERKAFEKKHEHAHTLYGAFLGYGGSYDAGQVVCEGYAKAFKAIADEMELDSILVAGTGKNESSEGPHMWNYVKIDEKWYLVDVTWNDPIDAVGDTISTKYVLIGEDFPGHQVNDGTLSGNFETLGKHFTYPTLSDKNYTPNILSSDTTLKSLCYQINGIGTPIDLTKPSSTNATTKEFKVTLGSTVAEGTKIQLAASVGDKVSLDGTAEDGVVTEGKATAKVKVKAEDGTTVTYIVNFEVAKSNDASLSSISYWVGGKKYDVKVQPGQKEIDIEVPYTTPEDAQVDIKAVPTNSAAKAEYQPIVLKAGKGTGVVNVVSADGKNEATYKINITTKEDPRSKANDITSFVLAGAEGKIENNVINVEVPYGTKLTDLTPTIKCSDKATVVVKGTDGVTADFSNPVTYVVTAENGTTKEYTVNVKVLSSIIVNQGLNNIKVYKGKNATFEIKYTPTISGDYTIVWNSATQKNVESHITLEADKTTSSALVLEKVTLADQGEVSVRISRDADSSDFVESKANFKLKSSNSSSGADSTTSSTNNNTSGGGGGGSATPAADKKVSEAWKDLSTAKQEEVKANFTNKMPYVLPANGLTEELVKELLGSDFSDAQVKEIVADPSKLKDLGISYTADTAVLTPVEEVNFKDINDSHWAYGNVEKLAKLGVVKGFEDNSFRPKEALAVADTFTFLNRVMLLNNDTYMNLSRETVEKYVTNKESWAFKDVATISSKLSEETLKEISALGDKPLSRGLLAQVLFEATQGKLAQSADSINFVDTQNSSYKEAIDYCVRAGLLKGVSANKMQPEKALTRAELMTVLVRLNDLMK